MRQDYEQATEQALQLLRTHPSRYDYQENNIPHLPAESGCLLGWIAHFADEKWHGWSALRFLDSEFTHLGLPGPEIFAFSNHFDYIEQELGLWASGAPLRGWRDTPSLAIRVLERHLERGREAARRDHVEALQTA